MKKTRVLLVDDAVVVRRIVSDVISEDPELEVVGTAHSGRIALTKLPQLNPDIVILDVEMPDMNGLETLLAIRKTYRLLPVIMFSTLTKRGAEATLDALSLGASDYVTKPSNVGSVGASMQTVRETLIPKIKQFCQRSPLVARPLTALRTTTEGTTNATSTAVAAAAAASLAPSQVARRAVASQGPSRIDIVAIATSTGGPDALNVLLPQIPADFPVPIVIVQHMPPMFTRLLAERLNTHCAITVSEATSGMALEAGKAWIAPGDFHLALESQNGKLQTKIYVGPPENSCRPAADVLFRSVAEHFAGRALGVVLTGMGQDGLRGSEKIYDSGGQIIAQDEATSVVWGMPGFVAQSGIASQVLPLSAIAAEIIRRAAIGRALPRIAPRERTELVGVGGRA